MIVKTDKMDVLKHENEYISYSRLYTFLSDRRSFFEQKILKKKDPEPRISTGVALHEIISTDLIDPSKLVFIDRKPRSNSKDFNKDVVYVSGKVLQGGYKAFKSFLEQTSTQKVATAIREGKSEGYIKSDELKMRGYLDVIHPTMIVDFKLQPMSSIARDSLKYGIQNCIYVSIMKSRGINVPLVYLSIKADHPFSCQVFSYPESWLDEVASYLNQVLIPEYCHYITECKKVFGEDIMTKEINEDDYPELISEAEDNQLLNPHLCLVPKEWDYKNLENKTKLRKS